jgi:HlyD family secretion protein
MGVVSELSESGDTLLVERPAGATQRSMAGLFVLDEASGVLQRLPVRYGRASGSLIQIVSGVSPGHRIVVSDMSAWDQFERLRLR